MNFQEV